MSLAKAYLGLALAIFAAAGGYCRPVIFEDGNLKIAVEQALGVYDPSDEEMLALLDLRAGSMGIRYLGGLGYAVNLQRLELGYNQITDIRPIAVLKDLQILQLYNNQITDFSPLAGLSNLRSLDIHCNPCTDLSFLSGLANLEYLVLHNMGLKDISAVCGLANLRSLDIYDNDIEDLSCLVGCVSLQTLYAGTNRISDISALAGLTSLQILSLTCNRITDIRPLAGLYNLGSLNLFANRISDISALAGLKRLYFLDISSNPLDAKACPVYIPQIRANNPGLTIHHDQCGVGGFRKLSVWAGPGGRVTEPGEGEFIFQDGQMVRLWAVPAQGFVFKRWSGAIASTKNPLSVVMDQDYQIIAEFTKVQRIIYVDDDAPQDPSPGDPGLSDPMEDGSPTHPYDSIQQAINLAGDGDRIVVNPGVYVEGIDILDRSIELVSAAVGGLQIEPYPILVGSDARPVIRFGQKGLGNAMVRGFVITKVFGSGGPLIQVEAGGLLLRNCILSGYMSISDTDYAIVCNGVDVILDCCTIVDNDCTGTPGLILVEGRLSVTNSIIWANKAANLFAGQGLVDIRYSDVQTPWPGQGNIVQVPLFAKEGRWDDGLFELGDYHLCSMVGRWDPAAQAWVSDQLASSWIDAGDPTYDIGYEPQPNGSRINIGAYAGTSQASKSSSYPDGF